jgi:hypothetical protein
MFEFESILCKIKENALIVKSPHTPFAKGGE